MIAYQKRYFGLFATFVAVLFVLLLHFPFDGYINEYSYTIPSFKKCPNANIETMREMGAEKFNAAIAGCQDVAVTKQLPFSEWRSNGALIYWFSTPPHAIWVVIFIVVIGGLWQWAARPK